MSSLTPDRVNETPGRDTPQPPRTSLSLTLGTPERMFTRFSVSS